ncbi:unnamed protein product, partial [Mesocestoides corti]
KRADEATSEESDSEVGWSKGSASEVSSHGGTPTRAAPKRRRTLIAPAASPSTPVPSASVVIWSFESSTTWGVGVSLVHHPVLNQLGSQRDPFQWHMEMESWNWESPPQDTNDYGGGDKNCVPRCHLFPRGPEHGCGIRLLCHTLEVITTAMLRKSSFQEGTVIITEFNEKNESPSKFCPRWNETLLFNITHTDNCGKPGQPNIDSSLQSTMSN